VRKSLELGNRLSDLAAVLDELESLLLGEGLRRELVGELRLIAEEGISNIILYAYESGKVGTIEVTVSYDGDEVKLELRDDGRAFNPLDAPRPDLNAPLEARPVEESRSFTKTMVLEGRLDNESAPTLDKELDTVLSSPLKVLVFDLQKLDYISSAGIRSLFRAQRDMKTRSGQALIVNPQPAVQKVFDIVKAVDLKSVFASVKELDAYLDTMQRRVTEGDE
jgi:anti-anti-sigma factor